MGVKGLWTLLTPVGRPVLLETMEGKVLAIDSSIWIYQFQATMRDKEGRGLVNAHVLGFLRRICKLLFYGIKPVFVFDGGAPALKRVTISERKNKKRGAAASHAKLAEQLLAAQMRKEALGQAAAQSRNKDAGPSNPNGPVIDENTVYLEDLDGSAPHRPPLTPSSGKDIEKAEAEASAKKRRNKFADFDPYRLPDVDVEANLTARTTGSKPDPRLATEEELRTFIDEMRPEDFDVTSPEFRELPTEVQYEIIGDLRLRSRATSHRRLESMLRNAPTPIDFSRAQIKHLKERNSLTQQLLTTAEGVGKVIDHHLTIPVRIASERNREYMLVKNPGADGGWVLGMRHEGTQEKPILLDIKEEPDVSEDENMEMDEVDIPASDPVEPDPDLREHMRTQALIALAERYTPKKPAPKTARPTLSQSAIGPARKPGSQPLFIPEASSRKAAVNEEPDVEWEEDEDLARAIEMSWGAASPSSTTDPLLAMSSLLDASLANEDEDMESVAFPILRDIDPGAGPTAGSSHTSLTGSGEPGIPSSPSESGDEDEDMEPVVVSLQSHHTSIIPRSGLPLNDLPSALSFVTPAASQPVANIPRLPDPSNAIASSSRTLSTFVSQPASTSSGPSGTTTNLINNIFNPSDSAHVVSSNSQVSPLHRISSHSTSPSSNSPAAAAIAQVDNLPFDSRAEAAPVDSSEARSAAASPVELERQADQTASQTPSRASQLSGPFKPILRQASSSGPSFSLAGEADNLPSPGPPRTVSFSDRTPSISRTQSSSLSKSRLQDPETPDEPHLSDEDDLIAWSRSPSPTADRTAAQSVEPPEDWDAAQEMDPEAEEGEFARFMSQVKGKDIASMQQEIDEEIRTLNHQRKNALRDSEDVTQQMITQIQTMLRLFGIPYTTAPMEAEAQCAELVSLGLVEGIITDDSDVFLFGGLRVFKNMFNQSKTVECFLLSDLARELSLDRDKLVRLAYLLGSDYVDGLPGVGPVVAMELMKEFPGEDGLYKFKEWWMKVQNGRDQANDNKSTFRRRFKKRFKNLYLSNEWPNSSVRDAYYHPTVDESTEQFKWGLPDLDALREFLHEELSWAVSKVDETLLPIIRKVGQRGKAAQANKQGTLSGFFDISVGTGTYAPRQRQAYSSKRLQRVVADFRKEQARGKSHGSIEDVEGTETSQERDVQLKTSGRTKRKSQDEGRGRAAKKSKPSRARGGKSARIAQTPSTEASDPGSNNDEPIDLPMPSSRPRRVAHTASSTNAADVGSEEDQEDVEEVPLFPAKPAARPRPKPRKRTTKGKAAGEGDDDEFVIRRR